MAYLMGIDVGTTGTKAILIEETGKVISSLLEEYPLYTPGLTGRSKIRRIGGMPP